MNSVPRCYLPASAWREDVPVSVPAAEAHHLARVLRLAAGAGVRVFDGSGRETDGTLAVGGSGQLTVRLGAAIRQAEPAVRLTLYQALLKNDRMDEVIQKAVELGVAELVPLAAAHAVVKLEGEKAAARLARWRTIALGAARQSGNPFLTEVRAPLSMEAAYAEAEGLDLGVFGSLEDGATPLWEVVQAMRGRRGIRAGLWIGPEGDWSAPEQAALKRIGLTPVTLGPLVLRAETAAFYGLSVMGAAFFTGRSGNPVAR